MLLYALANKVGMLCHCVAREDVYDLLRPGSGALTIREDIRKGVYVEGLCERVVEDGKSRTGWRVSRALHRV
jgi:hypothetical protein